MTDCERAYIRGIKDANPNMACTCRHFPGIRDEEIRPASLAPVLLQDLLRKEPGFNGLIISDASHMIGMAGVMARKDAVPACIAAGCDVFLFANDVQEDLGYLREGFENGVVTEEVPTVGVSLNYTNHRVDCANIHTFINACGPNRESIRTAAGKSKFHGTAYDTVFCGRRDTRL